MCCLPHVLAQQWTLWLDFLNVTKCRAVYRGFRLKFVLKCLCYGPVTPVVRRAGSLNKLTPILEHHSVGFWQALVREGISWRTIAPTRPLSRAAHSDSSLLTPISICFNFFDSTLPSLWLYWLHSHFSVSFDSSVSFWPDSVEF